MFAVQIGHYAWLGADGLVTTSMRHAQRLDGQMAGIAQRTFNGNRSSALVHLSRAARDFYTTAPVTVITAEELDARLHAITKPGDRESAGLAPVVAAQADRDATVRKNGITRQIYQWALDNPQAAKADALLAFPSANPSTVSVQFSAARRSQA